MASVNKVILIGNLGAEIACGSMSQPQIKLPGFLAIICICLIIAFLGYISETKRAHAKQIAQLSTNCSR